MFTSLEIYILNFLRNGEPAFAYASTCPYADDEIRQAALQLMAKGIIKHIALPVEQTILQRLRLTDRGTMYPL